jgi:two-component system, chemotaxis family, chemotaxis protein CheY
VSLKDSLQIMVVDDMSVSRALITNALDEIGIKNYRTENDGNAALAKLVANPAHLVLSDYNMPNLDGLGLLKALRMSRVTQRIGFILITGSAKPEVIEAGRALGMNNMIKKPFTTVTMRQCIESVVGRL